MLTIARKLGDFKNLIFRINLTDYEGKTVSDIEDIIFSVKNSLTDEDDALLIKKYTLSEITVSGTKKLVVNVLWATNEYANTPVGDYYAGLYVKFTGDPVADENTNQYFKLKIIQDYLSSN